MNISPKSLRNFAYAITGPATLILAILWLWQNDSRYEPIILILAILSGALLSLAQYKEKKTTKVKALNGMSRDELLQVVCNSDPKTEWKLVHSDIGVTAVYISDPALRIEHGYGKEYKHSDKFEEDWATKFADRYAVSEYYDLYYISTSLERFILVWVDGGRAGLPLPENPYKLTVKKIRYKIAMIFDTSDSVNQYMSMAGLKVAD